jgi:hypothetical protein
MMNKRGQVLSLNTIVIAILVITVLVVLIVVFTGQTGRFTRGLGDCATQGGTCTLGDNCPGGYSKAPLATCEQGKVCCIKVGEAKKEKCRELEGPEGVFFATVTEEQCNELPNSRVLGDSSRFEDLTSEQVCCEWKP